MHPRTCLAPLVFACLVLAACSHKDKNAPLAFVPADTPYAIANLDVLSDATRTALLTQADLQLPSQVAQMEAFAARIAVKDPEAARLVDAFAAELKGKTIEAFAATNGIDLKGRFALYGEDMAPVLRIELTDPRAFDAFVGRLETAWGSKLATATIGNQPYRQQTFAKLGTQLVLGVVGKQMVAALLPVGASQALLRQTLGIDRPAKNLQDDGRLAKLAKDKGYAKWLVGEFDLTRVLPLVIGGNGPFISALRQARANAESAQTGEPVANLLKTSPSCVPEAARIAARMPGISFGYTRLDAKHQDGRFDMALASDVGQAFSGLRIVLPGLGNDSDSAAPFDLSLALPVADLRKFWSAQVAAVKAKPFTCPMLVSLNDTFAKLGDALPKTAIPPFGSLVGVRIALDSLAVDKTSSLPDFTGRIVIGTTDPDGLLATGQLMLPALVKVKPVTNGTPVPMPRDLNTIFGQPTWLATSPKAVAIGIGAGEQNRIAGMLHEAAGSAGQMGRMHLAGSMYLDWLKFMEQKADNFAAAAAEMQKSDVPAIDGATPDEDAAQAAADAARSKAQFAAMEANAKRVQVIDAEMHIDDDGLVVTSHTTYK